MGTAQSGASAGGQLAGNTFGGMSSAGNAGHGGTAAAAAGTAGTSSGGLAAGGTGGGGAMSGGGGTSGGGGGAAGAPPNVAFPNVASSLVLRLEYDSGIELMNDHVSAWQDQSDKHNDAHQSDASFRPVLADVGGRKYVSLSGKVDPGGDGGPYLGIKDSDSLHFGTGDFAVLVVAGYDNATDHTHSGALGTFFGKQGTQQSPAEILFTGNWTTNDHTVENANIHFGFGEGGPPGYETDKVGFNDRKLRLYVGERIGDHMGVRVNGTDQGGIDGADNTDLSSPGSDVGIGSFSGSNSTRCLKGDVAAVIAVSGDQTSSAVAALEAYLMTKYPLAPLP